MLLLIETWAEACFWFSDCTSCSIVWCDSESSRSIHVSGNANPGLCPCRRRANSDTNCVVIGGFERAISAMIRIKFFGSFSAISII